MHEEPHNPIEILAGVALGTFFSLTLAVWVGARSSSWLTRKESTAQLTDAGAALVRLPSTMADPAQAWPERMRPGLAPAAVFWTCTAITLAVLLAGAFLALRWWARRWRYGTEPRSRLGTDVDARFATTRDLAPLVVPGPVDGRLLLGRVNGKLVATENRTAPPVGSKRQQSRARVRQGDRGGVALLGPSRCGKTTAAIGGIREWSGPAVLSSVKDDLLARTIDHRQKRGEVRTFAPTRAGTATWTPLRDAKTYTGARDAAKALADASPKAGIDGGGDYWIQLCQMLLTSLLWVAANTPGDSLAQVCDWVMTQDRPLDGNPGQVAPRLDALLASPNPEIADGARRAASQLSGIWQSDDRMRGSVYMTATSAIWPWTDPTVEKSAASNEIDLDWLLSGNNTLYLSGPLKDQRQYGAAFGGLLGDLMDQVFAHVDATGQPLDPPLLLVLDEAGNTPLAQLPEWASVVAGLGVQLVTIWQSKAQIDATYGEHNADTILTNHLTKIGFAGLSDRSSLDYFTYLVGDEQVAVRSLTSDLLRSGGGSLQQSTISTSLAPAHVVRQQLPGHALMIHGTLPPAHLEAGGVWTRGPR